MEIDLKENMINQILNQAQYELFKYPHYTVGDYLSRPFKAVFSRNSKPLDKIGFGNGLLAKALMDYYKKNVNTEEAREVYDVVRRYYDRWIIGGCKMTSLADVYSGMALIDLYEISHKEKYKKALDKICKYVSEYETDEMGTLLFHPEKKDKLISVDTIGYVCPFLAKYGAKFDDLNATSIAVTQIQAFLQNGMDEKLLIPYHGYDSETGIKYGIVGWGMAVGRLLIGLSELLNYMESANGNYELIKQAYRRIVDKVETYQNEGGLYNWQLCAKDGPADTGATALILYSIAESLENKVLIGIHKSRMLRGLEALKMCVQEDGSLPGASCDTDEFNKYPIDFNAYPWASAMLLSLLVMTEENTPEKIL